MTSGDGATRRLGDYACITCGRSSRSDQSHRLARHASVSPSRHLPHLPVSPSPISPSPRLRVSPSPRLPVSPSPCLPVSESPIAPDWFAFSHECVDALVGILRLHQLMQVDVLDFCQAPHQSSARGPDRLPFWSAPDWWRKARATLRAPREVWAQAEHSGPRD